MTFLEFKTKAEELGYTVTIDKSAQDKSDEQYNRVHVYLENSKTSISIAKIFEDNHPIWWFAHDAVMAMDIERLIEDFNNTPIAERKYDITSMTDMDMAKLVIDGKLTITEITNATGISKQSIINYRNGKTSLDKAQWEVIHKLARLYNRTSIRSSHRYQNNTIK